MTSMLLKDVVLSDDQFKRISRIVKDLCGINLHEGKKQLVKSRLAKRLRELKLPSYEAYIEHVRNDTSGTELTVMLDSLATNTTHFFREGTHFDYLCKTLLPELLTKNRAQRKLRIWSAGCSAGDEPYTLAILLKEISSDLRGWDAKILATDISTKILKTARQGVYAVNRLRQTNSIIVSKYFTRIPGQQKKYRIDDSVRKLVHFGRLNLMDKWPMHGPFDIIFCRNVMIYFDKPTQEVLVNRFWDILAPGGALLIGHSESLTGVQHKFKYVEPTVYRK